MRECESNPHACLSPCDKSSHWLDCLIVKIEPTYGVLDLSRPRRRYGLSKRRNGYWHDPLYRWLVLQLLRHDESSYRSILEKVERQRSGIPEPTKPKRGRPPKVWDISGEPDPAVAAAMVSTRYLLKSMVSGGHTGKLRPKSLAVLRAMMSRAYHTHGGNEYWASVNLMLTMAIHSFYREHPDKVAELRGHTNKRIPAERAINRVIRADRLHRFVDDPEDYQPDPNMSLRSPLLDRGDERWLNLFPTGKITEVTGRTIYDEIGTSSGWRAAPISNRGKAQQSYVETPTLEEVVTNEKALEWLMQDRGTVPPRIKIVDYLIELGTLYNLTEGKLTYDHVLSPLTYDHVAKYKKAWVSVICPFHEAKPRWEQSGAFHPEQDQYRCYNKACLNGRIMQVNNLKAWWQEVSTKGDVS